MNLKKILSTKAKIRFQDCDPFNHLNNAKYLDYFMNAREDQIKGHYGLDIFGIANADKIGWVVVSNQIAYLSPALTMETVSIQSQLIQFTDKSLLVEMTMWNEEKNKLKSLVWIKFVHVDLITQRSIKHKTQLMDLFDAVNNPVDQTVFEERCKVIIRTSRD